MRMFFSFLMLAASTPQIIARGVFTHIIRRNRVTNIRGGETKLSEKDFWGDMEPRVALSVSAAAMAFFAGQSAFPEFFADKYTASNKISKDAEFWVGWFGLGLAHNTLVLATAAVFGNDKFQKKLCFVQAINWASCIVGNYICRKDMDEEMMKVSNLINVVALAFNVAGSGVLQELGDEEKPAKSNKATYKAPKE